MPPSVLFVFSSVSLTLNNEPTGFSLPEVAHPYYVLAPWCNITFASPRGPNPPIDEKNKKFFSLDPDSVAFLKDAIVLNKLANAVRLQNVNPDEYDAVLYVGGYGSCIDLPNDLSNMRIASKMYDSQKIVAAVCHGLAALVNVRSSQGVSIFSGSRFTGFFNIREEPAEAIAIIESSIMSNGGIYKRAAEKLGPEVVIDGPLYTGQNASSARPLAVAILGRLKRIHGLY